MGAIKKGEFDFPFFRPCPTSKNHFLEIDDFFARVLIALCCFGVGWPMVCALMTVDDGNVVGENFLLGGDVTIEFET